jgi:hypothetical protein
MLSLFIHCDHSVRIHCFIENANRMDIALRLIFQSKNIQISYLVRDVLQGAA